MLRRSLVVPVALFVSVTSALALEGCPGSQPPTGDAAMCPPPDLCLENFEFVDGGTRITAIYRDGAVADGFCPSPPEGCAVA